MLVQTFIVSETPISEHYSHNKLPQLCMEKNGPEPFLVYSDHVAIALFSGI